MKIHQEGYRIILLVAFFVIVVAAVIIWLFAIPIWLEFLVYAAGVLTILFAMMFFRVPVRNADYGPDKIFSGADGKVVAIEEVFEDEYFKDKRKQVSVFMSATNVHVNFIPLQGKVKYIKYHPGSHLFAWLPKSSTDNERNSMVIENAVFGPVLVRQIAGVFARRIVCYPQKGDRVSQGSHMGIIKFGSRFDIFLPLHVQVKVHLNQHVRGGETLIAIMKHHF